jgi:MFS family permease
MKDRVASTFASIRQSRNFRFYMAGQTVSMAGTWMQQVAQGWLVLELTGSGTMLGFITAAQFVPVLFLGPLGGVVVDRFDTRRLLAITQFAAGVLAGVLGVLTITGVVQVWMVFVLAVLLGIVTVVDNPARQTIVLELVGPELLSNAITLNSVNINAARVVGPSIAALTIALVGVGPCFLLNSASYVAVIVALMLMDRDAMIAKLIAPRAKGQVREGFRYVWHEPNLRTPLVMMALIGTFAYEFQVILPVLAKYGFDGDAGTYGLMSAAMGVGAVAGGLVVASTSRFGLGPLVRVSFVFGLAIALVAVSPTLPVALAALVLVGVVNITFLARANTTLQLAADPAMRGRVMAMWTVAFLGSTPIGGPIVGYIGQVVGPRWALATGAAACIAAAAIGAWRSVVHRDRSRPIYRSLLGAAGAGSRSSSAMARANHAARSS